MSSAHEWMSRRLSPRRRDDGIAPAHDDEPRRHPRRCPRHRSGAGGWRTVVDGEGLNGRHEAVVPV